MLKIIPGATGYFNKTLNSNQFDNEDAIKDKLDNRGSIKGKLNNIYGKSIYYAALRHRDIIIAKIDLFIQRIGNDSNLLIVFYVQIMPDD
ncbi:hypothetical protein ACMG5I_13855, partial [Escherichia coli]